MTPRSARRVTRRGRIAAASGAEVQWSQTDMAQMEFEDAFDAAYCVGTSFGLFDDERNAEVARRLHRALKPHGTFLMQVLNRDQLLDLTKGRNQQRGRDRNSTTSSTSSISARAAWCRTSPINSRRWG